MVLSDSDFSNMNVIRELLYIKHNFANMTLYSRAGFKPDRTLFGKNVGARPHINFLTLMYKNIR